MTSRLRTSPKARCLGQSLVVKHGDGFTRGPRLARKRSEAYLGTRATNERQGAVAGQAAAPLPYLVAEVAGARKDHSNIVLVAGLDAFVVALGAAGLDDAGHAMGSQDVNVVAEREEGIGT